MPGDERMTLHLELRKAQREGKEAQEKLALLEKEVEYVKKEFNHHQEKAVLLTKMLEMKKEMDKTAPHHFHTFWKARVRVDKETEHTGNITDLWRSYKYWCEKAAPDKKLSQADLLRKVEEVFGKPERPLNQEKEVFKGIYFFFTDEDVEEYDKEVLERPKPQV
jgi:hypothetical protein